MKHWKHKHKYRRKVYGRFQNVRKHKQRYNYGTIPLEKAEKLTFYHGTTKEKSEKILREGLKPHGGALHLTPRIGTAVAHSISGPEAEPLYEKDHEPTVLKITLPVEKINDLERAKETLERQYYDFILHEGVSPEYITEIPIERAKKKFIKKSGTGFNPEGAQIFIDSLKISKKGEKVFEK